MTTPLYYALADGYNASDGSLTKVTPQPRMVELAAAAELNWYGDNSAQSNGFFTTTLEWNIINADERAALLALFGLSTSIASNQITISLNVNRTGSWSRWNAVGVYLQDEKPTTLGFSGFHIVLNSLEASS